MNPSSKKRCARIRSIISKWKRYSKEMATMEDDETPVTDLEQLKQGLFRFLAYNPSCLPLEKRLHKLNAWNEFLYNRGGLKTLLHLFESTHKIELEIEKLEEHLQKRGIVIDGPMFHDFCAGSLTSSTPELDVTPSTSAAAANKMKKVTKEKTLPNYVTELLSDSSSNMIVIGPNGTSVPRRSLEMMDWSKTGSRVTRKLLVDIFGRKVLACHSLSGKGSPAFEGLDMPTKGALDEKKVEDITQLITKIFDMTEGEVRESITSKCADESKMERLRKAKANKSKK